MKEDEPMVELTGDIFALDSFDWTLLHCNSSLYSVVKEDDKYWLKSPQFGLLTDDNSLRTEAKELVPVIKGSAGGHVIRKLTSIPSGGLCDGRRSKKK